MNTNEILIAKEASSAWYEFGVDITSFDNGIAKMVDFNNKIPVIITARKNKDVAGGMEMMP